MCMIPNSWIHKAKFLSYRNKIIYLGTRPYLLFIITNMNVMKLLLDMMQKSVLKYVATLIVVSALMISLVILVARKKVK